MKKSINLAASVRHALAGITHVIRYERNARIHVLIALCVMGLAACLNLDVIRWALLFLAIGLVFTAEMLNTVVELLIDLAFQQIHPLAKTAKDVAAGAVLMMALVAIMIGVLVIGPAIYARIMML